MDTECYENINNSWKELTKELFRRNDVAIALLHQFRQTRKMDTTVLNNALKKSVELYRKLQTESLVDSLTVVEIKQWNQEFMALFGRTLMQLENHPTLKDKTEIQQLITHLQGSENRIKRKKEEYNKVVADCARLDLMY